MEQQIKELTVNFNRELCYECILKMNKNKTYTKKEIRKYKELKRDYFNTFWPKRGKGLRYPNGESIHIALLSCPLGHYLSLLKQIYLKIFKSAIESGSLSADEIQLIYRTVTDMDAKDRSCDCDSEWLYALQQSSEYDSFWGEGHNFDLSDCLSLKVSYDFRNIGHKDNIKVTEDVPIFCPHKNDHKSKTYKYNKKIIEEIKNNVKKDRNKNAHIYFCDLKEDDDRWIKLKKKIGIIKKDNKYCSKIYLNGKVYEQMWHTNRSCDTCEYGTFQPGKAPACVGCQTTQCDHCHLSTGICNKIFTPKGKVVCEVGYYYSRKERFWS